MKRSGKGDRYKVGLLFGGRSVEHEVSVVSARGISAGFDPDRIECVPLAVTPKGVWLGPERSARILHGGGTVVPEAGEEPGESRIHVDPGGGGLFVRRADRFSRALVLDAVFPIIHGYGGEDGRLQGVLELSGLPWVGAGVAGSAAAMDKAMAKGIVHSDGILVPPWTLLTRDEIRTDRSAACQKAAETPGFPMFVKPANGGSSVGISQVDRPEDLDEALNLALAHDHRVVVEKALDAREIEVAVLGGDPPTTAVPGEIVPGTRFYTYEDKYENGLAELRIPADLPPGLAGSLQESAVRIFTLLDLAGMARIDFLLERGPDRVYFNEANSLPGFTPISMYPKMWEASGLPYPALLTRLVELALRRKSAGP